MNEVANLFLFDELHRQHKEEEQYKLFQMCCEATNHMAIHAQKLTEYMRKKHSANKVRLGRMFFYMFPRDQIPHEIYYKVVRPTLGDQKGVV